MNAQEVKTGQKLLLTCERHSGALHTAQKTGGHFLVSPIP